MPPIVWHITWQFLATWQIEVIDSYSATWHITWHCTPCGLPSFSGIIGSTPHAPLLVPASVCLIHLCMVLSMEILFPCMLLSMGDETRVAALLDGRHTLISWSSMTSWPTT
jgi:hypothetical protein